MNASGHGDSNSESAADVTISPIPKERAKIDRSEILSSAEAVMEIHAKRKAILDFVFVGERGYGSGVTAAFYSAVAHNLQLSKENRKLQCWYVYLYNMLAYIAFYLLTMYWKRMSGNEEDEDDIIRHPNGLFPHPSLDPAMKTQLRNRFKLIGYVFFLCIIVSFLACDVMSWLIEGD